VLPADFSLRLMTEIEFLVRIARTLLPGRPKEALGFLTRAETETVDRRLRTLIRFAFVAIESDEESQPEAAGRWLDRALSLIENRKRVRAASAPMTLSLVGVDDDHNERPVVPLTGGQPGAARPGLSGQTAEEIEAQLRQLGFAAIVYTPKEILEIVEDFNIPKFGAIEMA
jgi:hypothetical protein